MLAQYGVARPGLPGRWPSGYDDAAEPYTPAWQEAITGVPAAAARIAREFARNAEEAGGRSMIIMGAGTNHWFHSDTIYRSFLALTTLTGCQGVNGGGWAHYVGQEKCRPVTGWAQLGTIAGVCTLGGLAILIYRRRTVGPVFTATTRNDKLMYAVLTLVIVLGLAATVMANLAGGGYDYRATVSPWFRSILYLRPDPALMAGAPPLFQLHALSALLLFAIWPFTRLVHMLTAPVGYLTRPYIVYRSRDDTRAGSRTPRRGWEPSR
nr:respiratory nitrate reductase subunit gamma [Thermoactinospora rubra]